METLQIEISEVGIKRINTVGVYNETTFKNGKYLYTGNFYMLYVENEASYGPVREGMNVILVPDSIFVNSQLYEKIENDEVSYLQGSDAYKAKVGSIDRKDMGVHIVGMFFFETNKSNLEDLLTLLTEKNSTGKKFANYKAIVAEEANLPEDVLQAIPLQGIWNSPTGDGPKDTWGYIRSAVTNAVVSVANFIYNGLVAVGNLIEHAAEIVVQFAMKLLKATQQAIQTVVEVVKKLVDAIRDAIIGIVKGFVDSVINPLFNKFKEALYNFGKEMYDLSNEGKDALNSYFITHVLPVVIGVGAGIYTLSFVIGKVIEGMPIGGAIVLGAVVAGLTAGVLGTIMTSKYYSKGKNMDTSINGIKNWLHSVNPGLSTAYSSVVDFWSSIFLMDLLGDETGQKTLKSLGIYFVSIFASMFFLIAQPPTEATGVAMLPFLALASVSGGNTILTILKGIFSCWSPETGMDWGTAIALIAIGALLGYSVYQTIIGDLGYLVDAFT